MKAEKWFPRLMTREEFESSTGFRHSLNRREVFSSLAMQSILSFELEMMPEEAANLAVIYADALIERLKDEK
jgi:hypothetical protein